MQTNISKLVEAVMVRAVFNATKLKLGHSLKDFLLLELLSEEDSLAYQILSSRLKDWELFQVQLSIEQQIQSVAPPKHPLSPSGFYHAFAEDISIYSSTTGHISTAHILRAIIGDHSIASSRILEMYGITVEVIDDEIKKITENDIVRFETELQKQRANRRSKIVLQSTQIEEEEQSQPLSLDKFGVDLTQRAREGKIDPVVGREEEIGRIIQILSRRKKNNPMLIGEAGVGKSAVVEGLALHIAQGKVPHTIADKKIFSLDMSALVAGTKFRGEFEERMQQLLEAMRKDKDTIIFIDEIHTIVGTGATQGSLDTANILKPALARGELQTIGTTTLDSYRKDIESDPALERRFQTVLIEPPTAAQTLQILHNIAPYYEHHHNVSYTEEALQACVSLAERYITNRSFPDKAIDILDEAGSRIHLQATDNASKEITAEHIRQVITTITGIPAERISQSEAIRLQGLSEHLSERVIGQREAVEKVARTIRSSRAGLRDANRPIGVFLFVGPTGVGKTLLAKELSKWLFAGNRGVIRVDMSEYGEKHNVSRLIGSPPGYVGYGEGGQLSEAVRRQPYSVVLLDEIEKAHPEVFNIMLQIFDEGHLTDGSGRKIDFRNTIIIMTSNIGSRSAVQAVSQVGYGTISKTETLSAAPAIEYRKALERTFAPEFLNRIDDIIIFRTLDIADVERIIDLELESLFGRIRELGYKVEITEKAKRCLARRGYQSHYGARSLKRTLSDLVEAPLSGMIIDGKLKEGETVKIAVKSGELVISD